MEKGILRRMAVIWVLFASVLFAEELENTYSQPIAIRKWISAEQYPLDAMCGRPYLIEFWATWCPGCVQSIPAMQELYDKYNPQGLRILGLSIDKDYSAVASFIRDKDIKYPVAIDAETDRKYESKSVPAVFLVDAAGFVVWKGYPHKSELEPVLDKLLAESPKPVLIDIDFSEFVEENEKVEEGKSFMAVFRKLKAYTSRENPLQQKAQNTIDTIEQRLAALVTFAENLEKQDKDEAASNVYMSIVKNYRGSEGAKTAGEKIKLLKQKALANK